ncbi:MAG TPA: hypothetical protein VIJ93_02990 [bacterium]
MELTEKEKERIAAEEKYRMELRNDRMKEYAGWGRCGHGGGCYGGHCHRGGWFKLVFLGLAIFAFCHWCHHSYNGACGYGSNPPAASVPAAPAPSKN